MNSTLPTAALSALLLLSAAAPAPSFSENFDTMPAGKPAKEKITIIAGAFEVKDVGGGNKVLELPGEPLETFGAMFGQPSAAIEVRAMVWGATTGKRYPEFGIGAADVSGYKLLLLPRQKRLVIRKADAEVASAPYDGWTSESWTLFRLTVEPAGNAWQVTGYAWPAGGDESKAAKVVFNEPEKPPAGKGSIWGMPFSAKPIRFDDIEVRIKG